MRFDCRTHHNNLVQHIEPKRCAQRDCHCGNQPTDQVPVNLIGPTIRLEKIRTWPTASRIVLRIPADRQTKTIQVAETLIQFALGRIRVLARKWWWLTDTS